MRARSRMVRRRVGLLSALACAGVLGSSSLSSAQCVPSEFRSCLEDGRYRVEVLWRESLYAPNGATAHALGLTPNTAAFWFFQPGNLELMCKVLDARTINERSWLFAAALTSVEFELRATDTREGWRKTWFHPASGLATIADTAAFADDPLPGTVMFVGAHPDDESLASPVLGQLCVERKRRCVFLVATRGESGRCGLPGGCLPDLASVRSGEMQNAASLFGASLIQWSLPDVPGPDVAAVRAAWAATSGSEEALIQQIGGAIAAAAPDTVIAFDPRHGSTCHPAHRALGELVRQALGTLGTAAPAAFLLETRVTSFQNQSAFQFSSVAPEDLRAFELDGNTPQPDGPGLTAWDFLLQDVKAHPSQFGGDALSSLSSVPAADRQVRLLPLSAFGPDPAYSVCDPSPAQRFVGEKGSESSAAPTSGPALRRPE